MTSHPGSVRSTLRRWYNAYRDRWITGMSHKDRNEMSAVEGLSDAGSNFGPLGCLFGGVVGGVADRRRKRRTLSGKVRKGSDN